MRILWITSIILLFTGCKREITQEKSTLVKLSNKDINLTINMYGGNIIGFSFNKDSLNPFTWKLTSEQMPDNNKKGAPFEGHFLCLGRWGSPTEGEKAMGVPYNGEASNSLWNYKNTQKSVEFSVDAPKDGMSVKRSIELDSLSPVFYATDIIKSTISIGRLNNIVQHITVGPPFMDSNLIINTNASKGFLQTMSYPDPTKYEFTWPEGYKDSTKTPLDLTLSNENFSYVSTHIYEDSLGWIVAYNPKKQLLLGYIWRTAEYHG